MVIVVFDKVENIVGKVRKQCEKKRKCLLNEFSQMLLTSILSISHNVLVGFYNRVVKSRDCVVNI